MILPQANNRARPTDLHMVNDLLNPVLVCSGSHGQLAMLQWLLDSEWGIPSSVTVCAANDEPQVLYVCLGLQGVVAPVKLPPGQPEEARLFVDRKHAIGARVRILKLI
jgi:hypothetical protein